MWIVGDKDGVRAPPNTHQLLVCFSISTRSCLPHRLGQLEKKFISGTEKDKGIVRVSRPLEEVELVLNWVGCSRLKLKH